MAISIDSRGIEPVLYQFFYPTEEEKKQNIVAKVLCDWKGLHKNNFDHIVRFKNVKFVSKKATPKTYEEYKDVELIFEDNAFDDVDDDLIEAAKRQIYRVLYLGVFVEEQEELGKVEFPFDIMTSDIY